MNEQARSMLLEKLGENSFNRLFQFIKQCDIITPDVSDALVKFVLGANFPAASNPPSVFLDEDRGLLELIWEDSGGESWCVTFDKFGIAYTIGDALTQDCGLDDAESLARLTK